MAKAKPPEQDLLKRVEKLEAVFDKFSTEFSKVVNDLGESAKNSVMQVWENQQVIAGHLQLIDEQVMILVNMLEAHGIHVPAPGEVKDAQSNQSEA